MSVKRLGVVGSGIMGSGVAEVAAKAGIEVVLRSRSQATADAMVAGLEKSLNKQVDRGKLEGQDAVTYDVVKTSLEDGLAAGAFEFGNGAQSPYVVTQLGGAYVNEPDFLSSRHPLTTRDQTEAYLTRLQQYARVLDQESQMIADDAGEEGEMLAHHVIGPGIAHPFVERSRALEVGEQEGDRPGR